jgi:CubicO group peptidase (beta-lactamase class C family)
MRRKWLLGATAAALAGVAAALLYAPYLPRILAEGYPQATWPAPGSYARVAGASEIGAPASPDLASPNEWLQSLFEASEGRALLAARNGRIVMEHYAPGVTRETRLNSYSLVKSLVGALTLKAAAEGRIASLETKVGDVLVELRGTSTGDLPLCRLLNMTSGLAFEARGKKQAIGLDVKDLGTSKFNVFGPMARLHMTGLQGIQARLFTGTQQPTDAGDCAHGTFSYQNVNTALAGAVLEQAYQRPLQDLLSEKIWKPAGAAHAEWRRYDTVLPVSPYCCLYARPLDWLRVAQFLQTNGSPESPFLPQRLWREFLGTDLPTTALRQGFYVHHVYHNVLDRPGETLQGRFAYFFGSRGQTVYLMPEQDLVVIRFGGKIQLLHSTLYGVGQSIGARK